MERRKLVGAIDLGFRFAVLCLMACGGIAALIPTH